MSEQPFGIDPTNLDWGPDIDLETEVVLDSAGERIDQAYVDRAVAEVDEHLAKRAVGRPSLTGTSAHSPSLNFRVTPELKARGEEVAADRGTTVSKLARQEFERAVDARLEAAIHRLEAAAHESDWDELEAASIEYELALVALGTNPPWPPKTDEGRRQWGVTLEDIGAWEQQQRARYA